MKAVTTVLTIMNCAMILSSQNIDLNMIDRYGFPIFACVAMALYIVYMQVQHRKDLKEFRESIDGLKGAIDTMKTAVEAAVKTGRGA